MSKLPFTIADNARMGGNGTRRAYGGRYVTRKRLAFNFRRFMRWLLTGHCYW